MRYDFYAYMDRMKYIKRWQLMRSVREENIMEHSWQVSIIAHALATIKNEIFGGNVNAEHIAMLALYHETGEVITGDFATPIKYFNPEVKNAIGEMEHLAKQRIHKMLPEELQGAYAAHGTDGGGVDHQSMDDVADVSSGQDHSQRADDLGTVFCNNRSEQAEYADGRKLQNQLHHLHEHFVQLLDEGIHIVAVHHGSLLEGFAAGVGAEQAVHAHVVEHANNVFESFFGAGAEHLTDGHILMDHLYPSFCGSISLPAVYHDTTPRRGCQAKHLPADAFPYRSIGRSVSWKGSAPS